MRSAILSALMLSATAALAQGYSIYENSQHDPFQREMYVVGNKSLHSSIRMYKLDELRHFYNLDSLIYDGIKRPEVYLEPRQATEGKPVCSNVFRNLIHDDLLAWRIDNKKIYVGINPYCDFEMGKDGKQKTFTNSRGFYINGTLGNNFWFYIDFSEVQSRYDKYLEGIIDNQFHTIPGQSNYKRETDDYDFQTSKGYIGFNVGEYIDFQIGKGKMFIGDGYRSLLLSDAAPDYPHFQFNVRFLNCRYMMMVAQLQTHDAQGVSNNGFQHKYSFTHYLDWNIGRRFSLGFFENVTQAAWRKTGESRSIDFEYLNPFVVFRPGEYNSGSPDKMIVGLNSKFIIVDGIVLHGQLMFNEFRIKELTSDKGYWSNKYAFLLGLKTVNLFGAKGLDWQAEYSQARPFCYSQYDGMASYTHHNQSLAHPLGANFREFVTIASYKHKRLMLRGQFNFAQYGDDIPGDTLSYGHNPVIRSTLRNASYGIEMLQGNKTTVKYVDLAATFLINPRNRMNFTMGMRMRDMKSDYDAQTTKNFYCALRWSLKNKYYDY